MVTRKQRKPTRSPARRTAPSARRKATAKTSPRAQKKTAAGARNATADTLQQWIDAQRQQWDSLLAPQPSAAENDPWRAFTHMPFARHMPYGGAGLPGNGAFDAMARAARLFDPLDQMASLPGLGYLREQHEDFSRLYKAWQAHETAQGQYTAAIARLMLEALTHFETSIAAPRAGQKPFASLKDIYAHWVGIGEEAYARFAASPAHTALYGDLVNTLSAFRREMTVTIDRWAGQMNLPTRAEVDTLHKRLHDMKREMQEIKRTTGKTSRRRT